MGNGSETGKIRTIADKASHPYVMLAGLIITASGVFGGVKWGLAEIALAKAEIALSDAKADTAVQIAKKIEGSMDTFIMLQREANSLKREEMVAQGIEVQTRSVSSSSSETSQIIESSVEAASIRTSSGTVIIEYKPDSMRFGVIRRGDTIFVPTPDTAATRPR